MVPILKKRIQSNLPWLGILALIILSIAFLLPVLPNDFWWYLRLGKDIILNGSVPMVDTYSSTAFGQPVSYPMWLSAVIMYGLYQLGDLSLIVLSRGLLVVSFYILLWIICVRQGLPGWLVTLLTLISALAGANNWAVRPQMFVFPLFGLTLLILDSTSSDAPVNAPDQNKEYIKRYIWLIPIALIWANIHGSVILLFLLAVPYFLFFQRNRIFFFIVVLAFLATFINPRGPLLWVDTLQLIQASGNQFSQEWKAPINSGWQMNIFFLWFLLFIPIAAFSKNKLQIYQWVWFLGFGWMALTGVRYVIWFLAILLIFSTFLIKGILKNNSYSVMFQNIKLNILLVIFLLVLPMSLLPGLREKWWNDAPMVISQNTPVKAANWINENLDPDELIFNDYLFGSYMIFASPEYPVWIDSRFYPYSESIWENYLSISNAEPGWLDKLINYQIEHLILDNGSQKNLILALEDNNQYCEMFSDDVTTIFSTCK
jgi:hypothetical protein